MNRSKAVPGLVACTLIASGLLSVNTPHASGWIPNGTPLVTLPRNQLYPTVTTDGVGGAIVAWQDSRSSSGEYHQFDIYARRIDASGIPMWTDNGVALCTLSSSEMWPVIVADGSGGAIIVWTCTSGPVVSCWDIYAQRVNAAGTPMWPENGVPVCTDSGFQAGQVAVSDGAGGAIIAWWDFRSTGDIYAQHISALGAALWTTNGVPLCLKQGRQQDCVIASDGAGGAIVAWDDTSGVTNNDIYAQRITGSGTALWTTNGVPLCTLPDRQREAQIIADGVGGAIVVWRDERTWPASDLFMQRVNDAGVVQWAANGVALCTAAGWQSSQALTRDGNNVLITWTDNRNGSSDIYAQSIDLSGSAFWGTDGIALSSAPGNQSGSGIVSDGNGGAIVAWTDWRGAFTDVYAQRVAPDGQVLWTPGGDAVCTAAEYQFLGGMTSDGDGGALMSWSDCRDLAPDVYAQRVGPEGPPVTGVDRPPAVGAFKVLPNYPNPFAETTDIEFELPGNTDVVTELFDVQGRRLRSDRWGALSSGWNRLTIRGRDDRGRGLPSAVYFLRITAGHSAVTRKIVIAR
jgi:hypothetical protein